MKAIRYQFKTSNKTMIAYASAAGNKVCQFSIFFAVIKRTANRDNKQNFNLNLRENAFEPVN